MNKTLIAGIAGIFVLAALMVGVYAYGPGAQQGQMLGAVSGVGAANTAVAGKTAAGGCAYHDQMEAVLETGTYADLVALRAETGRQMMPWAQDDETFAQAQQRHTEMEVLYGEGPHGQCGTQQGAGQGKRMGSGRGMRGQGNAGECPMLTAEQ
jgi:hypothetical protein